MTLRAAAERGRQVRRAERRELLGRGRVSADWKNARDFNLVMTNAPGAKAYPITATTFILMPKQPKDKAKSDAAIDFFNYALENGQDQANEARLRAAAR